MHRTSIAFLLFVVVFIAIFPQSGVAAQRGPVAVPTVGDVNPGEFASGVNTPITISGSNFVNIASVTLGETPLLDFTIVDTATITAQVPWDTPPGLYAVTVTNTSSENGTMPNAVNVTPALTGWASNGPYGGALTNPSIDPQDPNRIYVSAQRSGVFFSTDAAETWSMERVVPFPGKVHFVYPAGSSTPVMYMDGGAGMNGLQRSTDNGATWETKMPFWYDNSGIDVRAAVDASDPDLVYMAVQSFSDESKTGLYRSTNQGDFWTQFTDTAGLHVLALAVEPGNPQHILIGTDDGHVLVSTDGGANWSAPVLVDAAGGPDALADVDRLTISPFEVGGVRRIWALSSYTDWAYYSDDDGATWTPKSIEMSIPIYDFIYSDSVPGLMWAAVGGAFFSTDNGDTWTPLHAMIGEINHFALVAGAPSRQATTLYAATTGGMYKSTDGGGTWTEKDTGLGAALPGNIAVSPFNADEAFASITGKGFMRTFDGGLHWQPTTIPNKHYRAALEADPFSPGRYYFSLGGGQAAPEVYITDDHGDTYQASAITLPPAFVADGRWGQIHVIAADPLQSGHLLAGLGLDWKYGNNPEGLIYASTDGGLTWTQCTTPADAKSIGYIVFDPQDSSKVYAGTENAMLVSSDGGATWAAPAAQPDVHHAGPIVVDPRDSNIIYLFGGPRFNGDTGGDVGTFATHDGGATWVKLVGLEHYPVWALKVVPVNGSYWLYAATMNGLYFLRDVPAAEFDPSFSWEAAPGIAGVATVDAFNAGVEPGRVVYYIGTSGGELPALAAPASAPAASTPMPGGIYRRLSTGEPPITRSVPGWQWMNQSGFRIAANQYISALEVFDGELYASTGNWNGAHIYRSADGAAWTPASNLGYEPVFGSDNVFVLDMQTFGDYLYAGTGWGNLEGQIWRTADGLNWDKVSLMEFAGRAVSFLIVHEGYLYACASGAFDESGNPIDGLEVWRSESGASGSWVRVAENGFNGNINNGGISGGTVLGGELYLYSDNSAEGVTLWKMLAGGGWQQVNTSGFGNADNSMASGLSVLGEYLYAGTWNGATGGQIWRYDGTTWGIVTADGFGDVNNRMIRSLYTFNDNLYSVTFNNVTGAQTRVTRDGQTWRELNMDGFGTPHNYHTQLSNASAAFNGHFFVGTVNREEGGEVWQYLGYAPAAVDDAYTTNEDTALYPAAPGLLANDTDVDADSLTALLVSGPAHGALTLNPDGSFSYTPAANWSGGDSFTYQVSDGTFTSNTATVNINVGAVNDAPTAVDDAYTIAEDTPLAVALPGLLANDTDVEAEALTAFLVSGPTHGTLTLNADGSFSYMPDADWNGSDTFTYRASDGSASSLPASVTITVTEVLDELRIFLPVITRN